MNGRSILRSLQLGKSRNNRGKESEHTKYKNHLYVEDFMRDLEGDFFVWYICLRSMKLILTRETYSLI